MKTATDAAECHAGSRNCYLDELTEIRLRLFTIANIHAGNERGDAAIHIHESANQITEAMDCIERGKQIRRDCPSVCF